MPERMIFDTLPMNAEARQAAAGKDILTENWTHYLLPFDFFKQDALPNRNPNGFDPSAIFGFGVRVPKESVVEIWIDDLGFYRKKPPAAGN